jgi:hypothetical protein
MISLIGQLATVDGSYRHIDLAGDARYGRLAAIDYQRQQPARIPLLMFHDTGWEVGSVDWLDRDVDGYGLLAVGRIRDDLADMLEDGSDWYLSAAVAGRPTGSGKLERCLIEEVSLGRSPALMGARPISWCRGDLAEGGHPTGVNLYWRDAWSRAGEHVAGSRYRSAPSHLVIHDVRQLDWADEWRTDPEAARVEMNEVKAKARSTPPPSSVPRTAERVYRHRAGGAVLTFD